MTAWLVYSIITGACIALAAQGAEWLLKSARRPIRFVWIAGIAIAIAFTVAAPFRSEPQVVVAASAPMSLEFLLQAPARELTFVESIMASSSELVRRALLPLETVTELAAAAPKSIDRSVLYAAIASGVVALLVLLAVYARFMRERMKWPTMRLLGRNVRVTPNVGPAVLGLAPPEIVVPQWVLLRNAEEQRLVLEHEGEHVRANDPLLLMFACLAVACMPWNPAVWFMWSRLRLAVELDCDRRVLLRGVQKPAYGQLLVELSSRRPWMSPAVPAFSWGTSHLEQRLVAMTARPKRFRTVRRLASGAVIAAAMFTAVRAELPAELQAMDTTHFALNDWPSSDAATVSTDLRANRNEQSVTQDTIPRKKVRKAPVAVQKKAPTRKIAADSMTVTAEPTARVRVKDAAQGIRYTRAQMAQDSLSVTPLAASSASVRVLYNSDSTSSTALLRGYELARASVNDSASVRMDTIFRGDTLMLVRSSGTGTRIRVRGQSSLALNNEPLILLNGYVFTGSLKDLDPDNIENIEVIKGAKAVELYGAIASNGVITIRTKK